MGTIHVIAGGQFGSEGKGHFAAALIWKQMHDNALLGMGQRPMNRPPMVLVRVAGPNAGHTAHDAIGREWKLRQVPVGAVVDLEAPVVLGAGSEIDPAVLKLEISMLEKEGIPISGRLTIDWQATVIEDRHQMEESGEVTDRTGAVLEGNLVERIGSTGKGIGAARADRIMRRASIVGDDNDLLGQYDVAETSSVLRQYLQKGRDVLIEGTQGYGLGLHAGYYPYCTSSDCRATDFLAMAGLTPWDGEVVPWVVLRNEVIRVAGNSGPLAGETEWWALGLPEEWTTVTKKVRRVGLWDPDLAERAIAANGGRHAKIAYTMADHGWPELAGLDQEGYESRAEIDNIDAAIKEIRERLDEIDAGNQLAWIGTGPKTGVWL